MSEQDIKRVSTATGTFAVLKSATARTADDGNIVSQPGKDVPVSEQQDLKMLAKRLNLVSQAIGRDLRFQVDLETGRSVIQVLDSETGEIIRQIPPENAKTYVTDKGDVALRLYDDQV